MSESDKLRQEAKNLLSKLFNIPEGFSSGMVERVVDCIVSAAVLEVGFIVQRAIQPSVQPPSAQECKECFGYGGFHSDNCSHFTASRSDLITREWDTPEEDEAWAGLLRADPCSAVAHPTSESTADNRPAKSATSG